MAASASRTSPEPSDSKDAARELAGLREDFPGHRVWRGRDGTGTAGSWIATLHDPAAGIEPTVIRTNAAALRAALVQEGERAADKQRSH
ncbi:hypothetical protein [Actinomadura hibisca]|uniref:hypothetical protein n=1 Tax=Actinomadura hibisca TaxID=68565 RepID=UPI00082BE25A|nr:hypothetical protein [Actinomadura hibisca]